MRDFLNSDLNILPDKSRQQIKQINFENLDYLTRRKLIQTIIDKAIYTSDKITFFINIKNLNLKEFVCDNFINKNSDDMKFILNNNTITIEKEVFINKGISSNTYKTINGSLMTKTENNHLIIMAFAKAWKYKNLYEEIGNTDIIIEQEKTSWRNFYKSITLAYLSPKIINALMSGKLNMPLRDVYELASKSQDFIKQEQLFFYRT